MAFDIREFLDRLEKSPKKGKFVCPVCGGYSLDVNKNNGAYRCFSNECESADIRQAIAPLEEPIQPKAKRAPKKKAEPVTVNVLPTLGTLPDNRTYPQKGQFNGGYNIRYWYSKTQWIMRRDFIDPTKEKDIRPWHHPDGEQFGKVGKGDRPWEAYRIDEALNFAAGNWVCVVEGEKCVEAMRFIGIPAITFSGSAWTAKDFSAAIAKLKGKVHGLLIIPDHDDAGYLKGDKLSEACASHGYPCLMLNPLDIWGNMPERGDVADWIRAENPDPSVARGLIEWAIAKAFENQHYKQKLEAAQEIIAKTTTAIAPVSTYDESESKSTDNNESEQIEPDFTYQEIARREIYKKGHYVALSGEFYEFNGTHYEQRHQSEEIRKIRAWAGQYRVFNKRTGRWQYSLLNTKSINEIWKWVLLCYERKPDVINPPGVNLANGVLRITWNGNIPSWKLYPHTHKDIYLYCSPVAYDPNANPENCDRLLQCLDPAPRTALLRHLSAAFDLEKVRTFASRQIRAGIAKGTGSNGKDSIRAAIAKIFGAQMTCIDLGDFLLYDQGKRFYLKDFAFARVNWSSENNQETPLDKSQILNICITGEDNALLIEEKNVKAYRTTCKAIQIFNCNQLPKLKSGMDSLATRFVIYDFNKTFKSNPNLQKGELPADPRFHDDPEFLIKEVCPALLNKLLIELGNLAQYGIDYGEMDKGLERLKEQSSHLWQFANDTGLEADATGRIWVSELWETLRNWYIDNGTLEVVPMDHGKTKNIWHEQANKYDSNVTGANQIHKRMKQLFPKIERIRETQDQKNKGRFYLSGISFNSDNPASLLHNPSYYDVSASPTASLPFTDSYPASLPSLSLGEAKSEGSREAEIIAEKGSEAEKQIPHFSEKNTQPEFCIGDLAIYSKTREIVSIIALPTYRSDGNNTLHRCQFVENPLTEKFIPITELIPC